MTQNEFTCVICNNILGENHTYTERKNGEKMCIRCVALTLEVIYELLRSDEIIELLANRK
jgi:hypothetical protein